MDKLAELPHLRTLALRLSTDPLLAPFYFPRVSLRRFTKLDSLSLYSIADAAVLEDAGAILPASRITSLCLIASNGLAWTSTAPLLRHVDMPLRLTSLDLRYFDQLHSPRFWHRIDRRTLRHLTIRCPPIEGPFDQAADTDALWQDMAAAGITLHSLYTDMICPALMDYLNSVDGSFEHLFLLPCETSVNVEQDYLNAFIDRVLNRIVSRLTVLALYSKMVSVRTFIFDEEQLATVARRCRHLTELGLEVADNQVVRGRHTRDRAVRED